MCVCVCVCVCVCMNFVCYFVCLFACLFACLFVYLFVRLFVCVCVCVCQYLSFSLSLSMCLCVCLWMCDSVIVCACVWERECVCVCLYALDPYSLRKQGKTIPTSYLIWLVSSQASQCISSLPLRKLNVQFHFSFTKNLDELLLLGIHLFRACVCLVPLPFHLQKKLGNQLGNLFALHGSFGTDEN